MKYKAYKYIRNLTGAMAAALLLLPIASCSDSHDAPSGCETDVVDRESIAGFYITVGDAIGNKGSRAINDGGYDAGQGYENYIDVAGGDFKFMFFDRNDNYISDFTPTSILPESGDEVSKRYYVTGKVNSAEAIGDNFKVLVLANWGEYPEPVAGQKLSAIINDTNTKNVFSYSQSSSVIDESNPIPLFGIKYFSDMKFEPEQMTDIGTIHLLRAYAKITIVCNTPGWNMTNVMLTRYNTTGLKAPVGVNSENQYVKNDYDADYYEGISLPANVKVGENLPFSKSSNPGEYIVYVPEFCNINVEHTYEQLPTATRIKVNFEGIKDIYDPSKLRDFYVDFKQYGGDHQGHYYNIQRNFWYAFEVNKKPEDFDLDVSVDVIPFGEVKLTPNFGLERDDITGYVVVRDTVTKKIRYWLDNYGNKWFIYMDGKTHFVFAYDDEKFDNLDHWFDYTGIKHELTPEGITGYTPVYDTTFADKLLYWETPDGHKRWIVMTEYFSAVVYSYSESGVNPSGSPLFWIDFMGNEHTMSENEEEVLKDWIAILTGNLPTDI
ncbi:MAG: hypothetical protein NC343_08285 [Muribaculum sp.]|nr:hypothetical protein [Muribaculaceae bacterium]MCM1081735.1 hypothetical protein [Muribaculum sp.]